MKKILLLAAVAWTLFVSQAQAQYGFAVGWRRIAPSTLQPVNLADTVLVPDGQLRLGTSTTAGFVPIADARGVMTLQNISAAGGGDITAVTAGDGLKGGGTTGAVTLDMNFKLVGQTLTATSDSAHVKDNSIGATQLADALDLGGESSLEIPNGAAPTVDAFGEIAGDNDLWAASRGAPLFFDGTAATALVNVLVSDAPSNGQVPTWNTGGTITWETISSATTWDAIGDAAADGTIALAGFETDFTSTIDAAGEAVITITNTDADAAATNYFIDLRHNDVFDSDVVYMRMVGDNDGAPYEAHSFSQTQVAMAFNSNSIDVLRVNNAGLRVNGVNSGVIADGDPTRTLDVFDTNNNQSLIGGIIRNSHASGNAILGFDAGIIYTIGTANSITNDPFAIALGTGIGSGDDLLRIDPITDSIIIGGSNDAGAIYNFILGKDGTTGTLSTQTIRGSNAGLSADKSAADFEIKSGLPRGTGGSGTINFYTGQDTTSGSIQQRAVRRMTINHGDGSGSVDIVNGGLSVGGGTVVPAILKGSATLDFPDTGAGTDADLTITVTGADDGDPVFLGIPNGAMGTNRLYFAWVSASNTVTVRFRNLNTVTNQDPASATFNVTVFDY